jgi:phage-related holin
MIKLFLSNLFNKGIHGIPMADSIATVIKAIKEGKYDVKKSLWILVEALVVLGFVYVSLSIAKHFGLTIDQILDMVGKIMKLGLGN